MAKINKLHFNGIDYDIGDPNIHDLTEKTSINGNDELIIADSDNTYCHKKVKYSKIKPCTIDVLVVGGGGGGGAACNNNNGGGGGGGNIIEQCNYLLGNNSISVVIGLGGGGGCSCDNYCNGCDGLSSCFGSIVASGGCGGAGKNNTGGGASGSGYLGCGGGGGAGGNALCDGGVGKHSFISGTDTGYGGGGGGGTSINTGWHGVDGGGNSGHCSGGFQEGCPGTAYTGGGGGGGQNCGNAYRSGGAGGAGVVIVRYGKNGECGINCATGGNVYCCGNYVIHCFTSDGTFCIVN